MAKNKGKALLGGSKGTLRGGKHKKAAGTKGKKQ